MILLDLSKAFDRVGYNKLFTMMIEQNVYSYATRYIYIYIHDFNLLHN